MEIKKIIKEYYEQLYTNKLNNLDEMDKFLETQNLPRLNCKDIENLNRPVTNKEINSIIKNLPKATTTTSTKALNLMTSLK